MTMSNAHQFFLTSMNDVAAQINSNARAKGFWDGHTWRSRGPMFIALAHSELSEALEAMRDGNFDGPVGDHSVCEELADCIIRILDYAHEANMDLGHMILAKMEKNSKRPYMHGGKVF